MKFVSKQLAMILKEKGFKEPCFGYYYIKTPTGMNEGELVLNRYSCRGGTYKDTFEKHIGFFNSNIVDAPTIEQTLEWLREEKNIHIGIIPCFMMSPKNNIMWLWEILLVGKIIECKNTIYADKDYNYTELASINYYANYENACIASIEFVVEHLI